MGFLVGQGIGRWGNFVNQEAFGTNTTLPWGMYSEGTYNYLTGVQATLAAQGITVDPTQPVHPTFRVTRASGAWFGLLVLWLYRRHRRFHGQLFLMYIIWYGLGRYWIEGLRTDSLLIGDTGLRFSQIVALVSVAAAVTLMVYGLQRSRGRTLLVPLAVEDIKKQDRAGDRFTPDSLPASTPHREFVAATAAMNKRLADLDLDAPAGTAEPDRAPERQAEPEQQAEPAAPAPEDAPAEPARTPEVSDTPEAGDNP